LHGCCSTDDAASDETFAVSSITHLQQCDFLSN
jgi:hypothetical protein